jgi:hypothetical protein
MRVADRRRGGLRGREVGHFPVSRGLPPSAAGATGFVTATCDAAAPELLEDPRVRAFSRTSPTSASAAARSSGRRSGPSPRVPSRGGDAALQTSVNVLWQTARKLMAQRERGKKCDPTNTEVEASISLLQPSDNPGQQRQAHGQREQERYRRFRDCNGLFPNRRGLSNRCSTI